MKVAIALEGLREAMVGKYFRESCSLNFEYNSPPNSFEINAFFQSYFQKYDQFRQHLLSRSPGLFGQYKMMQKMIETLAHMVLIW